jgi:hypothetical protein
MMAKKFSELKAKRARLSQGGSSRGFKVSYDPQSDCGYIYFADIGPGGVASTIPIDVAGDDRLGGLKCRPRQKRPDSRDRDCSRGGCDAEGVLPIGREETEGGEEAMTLNLTH